MRFVLLFLLSIAISACEDQHKKFYSEGYSQGFADAQRKFRKECDEKIDETKNHQESSSYGYGVSSTEVCGGDGVNVGSKHYSAGKTGCVRVFSDGRVEKY